MEVCRPDIHFAHFVQFKHSDVLYSSSEPTFHKINNWMHKFKSKPNWFKIKHKNWTHFSTQIIRIILIY